MSRAEACTSNPQVHRDPQGVNLTFYIENNSGIGKLVYAEFRVFLGLQCKHCIFDLIFVIYNLQEIVLKFICFLGLDRENVQNYFACCYYFNA